MKKLTLMLVTIVISFCSISQTPQAFKYQAVARDNSGDIIATTNVTFRIGILQGSASGTLVFSETHDANTNEFGLVNLEIGNGVVVSGVFEDVNWGNGPYFLQIEMDETGGTSYQLMGTSQLLSVPYSLYSESTGDTTRWRKNNDDLYYDKGNVGVGTGSPAQLLSANGIIESMTEGFMFPDGSVQTTAALSGGGASDSIVFGGPSTAAEGRGFIGMLVDGVEGSWEWGLDCEGCSAVFDLDWSAYSTYEWGGGGSANFAVHNFVTIYKNIDIASVLLIEKFVTGSFITDIQFRFYRYNPDISNYEIYYTITLENVIIMEFYHDVYHTGNGVMAHMDKISFAFDTIIWEWVDGGIQYQHDLNWPTD